MVTIQTGSKCIDTGIGGGISPGTVTLIYGEPETGKTTLAMQCAVNCAVQNFKVLFVDCDNTFYAKRLSQIAKDRFDEVAERIILVKPKDFREQTALIDCIQDYTTKNVGLIIIDTFTSLYGAKVCETAGKAKAFGVNRELNRQLAILAQTTKIQKIPVIITSQVRSVFSDQSSSVRPVATRVLKFWADTIIALKPTHNPQTIKAVLEKAREITAEVTCYVQIGEAGIQDTQFH
ncbi:MAG: AAA family ATPase [Candidatus Bathyarchaeota archaeon]|nr:AAA family ATPase [Candidatus Bathyarchaeota archaeon]